MTAGVSNETAVTVTLDLENLWKNLSNEVWNVIWSVLMSNKCSSSCWSHNSQDTWSNITFEISDFENFYTKVWMKSLCITLNSLYFYRQGLTTIKSYAMVWHQRQYHICIEKLKNSGCILYYSVHMTREISFLFYSLEFCSHATSNKIWRIVWLYNQINAAITFPILDSPQP